MNNLNYRELQNFYSWINTLDEDVKDGIEFNDVRFGFEFNDNSGIGTTVTAVLYSWNSSGWFEFARHNITDYDNW